MNTVTLRRKTCEKLLGNGAFSALREFFPLCKDERDRISGPAEYLLYRNPETGSFFVSEAKVRPAINDLGADTLIITHRTEKPGRNVAPGQVSVRLAVGELAEPMKNNWLYRITLHPGSSDMEDLMRHQSFTVFRNGYFGITGKHPVERFKQHMRSVKTGKGYLLHRAWRSLLNEGPVLPSLTIMRSFETRDEALDAEEYVVDLNGTLPPTGLNAIPGGKAGMKVLWQLGLMSERNVRGDMLAARDIAMELMESERSPIAAHYRRGHIRKLPENCNAQTTWVNPCWVGLNYSRGTIH